MSACECHFCSSSVPSNGGSHGTPTWTTNSVLLLGSSNTNQQENMLELKTMFISLDICKIWWHSAGVWSFSFCYKQQPTKAQKRELLFSCQLPHWTSALTRLSEKGAFVAGSLQTCILLIQCSIILKRAFQFTSNTHLRKMAQDSPVPTLSYPAPRLRLSTQLQNNHSRTAQEGKSYTKREGATLVTDTSVASSSPSIITWRSQAAGSNWPFSKGCWEGEGPGSYIKQSQCLREGKRKMSACRGAGIQARKKKEGEKEDETSSGREAQQHRHPGKKCTVLEKELLMSWGWYS